MSRNVSVTCMQPITFFEHQARSYVELGWSTDDPVLEQIEQLNADSRCGLFHLGRHGLRAQQFVGVMRAGGFTLQVLPKIDWMPDANVDALAGSPAHQVAVLSATQNLLHLLSYAQDLEIREQDIAPLLYQRANWFELLTRLFASNLHKLIQQGLEHAYVRVEEDLPILRGRWLLEHQFMRHPYVRHRFDVAYDEFSPDTFLNRIFAFVVRQMLPRTIDPGNRRLLVDLREWLEDAQVPAAITQADLDRSTSRDSTYVSGQPSTWPGCSFRTW
jgi:5-methylcytosine-specific restriction enzyme subunit McrC